MQQHADLIRTFYAAFQRRDHAAMTLCYAPTATFSDPVFPNLRGPAVGAMWRMLCERGTDLRIEVSGIEADGAQGRARWEAWYTFSATHRPVHNIIHATFEFRDGLIRNHRDSFDLYRWSRQALGVKGLLFGWTPLVQNAIRTQAARSLDAFVRRHGVDQGQGGAR
jgi:ketosteroid isomerase-like protein